MAIAFLIPCLNPNHKTVELIQDLRALTNDPIFVIDDGSDQTTQNLFQEMASISGVWIFAHETNRGKGAAIKTGIAKVQELFPNIDGVVTADGDGQHLPIDMIKVATSLMENPKALILGTRDLKAKNVPFKSRWGNRITTFVFYLSSHRRVSDTQTGLRGFSSTLFASMLAVPGDRYEYEMNVLSALAKSNVDFIPVTISTVYIDGNRHSHFHAFRDSYRIYKPLLSGVVKMALVAIMSSLLDLGLFTLFEWLFFDASTTGILYATISARILSGIFNFLLNKIWTFRHKGQFFVKAIEYGALFIVQMLLSWLLVKAFSFIPINLTFVKAVIDFLLFIGSYFIQKTLIFREKPARIQH